MNMVTCVRSIKTAVRHPVSLNLQPKQLILSHTMAKQVYSLGGDELKRFWDQVHNGPEGFGGEMLE